MTVRLTLHDSEPAIEAILTCQCSEVIVKSRGDEEVIRAKVLIVKGNHVVAVCKRCNSEVILPLHRNVESARKPAVNSGPPLVLRK